MTPAPPPPPPAGVQDAEDLLQEVRLCYWKTLRSLDFRAGETGLTDRELLFLRALKQSGPLCSRSLSQELKVTPANITRLSAGLESRLLVEKVRDPQDHRRIVLTITKAGDSALHEAFEQRQQKLVSWLAGLSSKEVRSLTLAIRRLGESIEGLPDSPSSSAHRPRAMAAPGSPERP